MYKEILVWLDYSQRMEIALKHGVKTRQQVYNIVTGKCKNYELLNELIEKAEYNKGLRDRAKQLAAAQ